MFDTWILVKIDDYWLIIKYEKPTLFPHHEKIVSTPPTHFIRVANVSVRPRPKFASAIGVEPIRS